MSDVRKGIWELSSIRVLWARKERVGEDVGERRWKKESWRKHKACGAECGNRGKVNPEAYLTQEREEYIIPPAAFLDSSIRQSGRLLTARFQVRVLVEELKVT